YERGLLRGKKLIAAKRLVELRRRRGKGLATTDGKAREQMSADALMRAYREDTERKRALIRRTEHTRDRLLFITEALRRLSRDDRFVALLEDEGLATMPEKIGDRLQPQEAKLL